MRLGFLTDPLESLQPGHDSTLALMDEDVRRGHSVAVFEQKDLSYDAQGARARARDYVLRSAQELVLSTADAVFLRKDPPVDLTFLHGIQLASLSRGPTPLYVNAPDALLVCNEKLFALRFPELCPLTCVSNQSAEIKAFIQKTGRAVLKPLDGYGGKGVVQTHAEDPNLSSLIDLETDSGNRWVMVQEFLEAASKGDKRILLVDGEPAGAVLRVPSGTDFRGNLAVGGKARKTSLTPREKVICAALKPELQRLRLLLVGIDVIGDKLTEINVTSPTGIHEINALDGVRVESTVLDAVEKRVYSSGPNTSANRSTSPS
jgi:glutathione synthase